MLLLCYVMLFDDLQLNWYVCAHMCLHDIGGNGGRAGFSVLFLLEFSSPVACSLFSVCEFILKSLCELQFCLLFCFADF